MSNRCSCGASEIFHIDTATTPNTEFVNTVNPLAVASAWIETGKRGFFEVGGRRDSCELSAKVCTGCGRVEWFAKDLALLDHFAAHGVASVRRIAR